MADDLTEMRLLLARNFSPAKTVIPMSDDFAVACTWIATHGVLELIVGPGERQLIENIPRRRSSRNVVLRLDGLLIQEKHPWLSARDVPSQTNVSNLAVNCYMLELIHEKLLSFYLQIDFGNIRRRYEQHETGDAPDDEVLAVSCRDLVRDDEATEATEKIDRSSRRIRPLRMDKFLRKLEGLGCEIRGSRGSEVAVYRPGGRVYRLGHRKEVHTETVKNVLTRLDISPAEWCAAVYQ